MRRVLAVWQRSIQLRVVATTLVLSVAVMVLLGVIVVGQVRNGLLTAKEQASTSQAVGGFQTAKEQVLRITTGDGRKTDDPPAPVGDRGNDGDWLNGLVLQLASGGRGVYDVGVLSADGGDATSGKGRSPRSSGNVRTELSVSQSMRDELELKNKGAVSQPTRIVRDLPDENHRTSEPGLAVGQQLTDPNGASYQIFYFFPFEPEEKTLSLVRNTLTTAGVFLVLLLAAIAAVVTRQVVTPVRMAARIAERLAAGKLEERMKVVGQDDLARLASSFNKMANNLQNKIRQLEELSRVQRRFVSDVSHELRTPLTTVRMAADLLHDSREGFTDPSTARAAELLQTQLDRFESLLGDLLEISRFDAGAAVLDAEPSDLRDLVRRVVEAAEPLADRKNSRIVVDQPSVPVVAEVDPRRLDRILRNLIVNAVEHGEGRDVVVRLATNGAAVGVAVRDYGVGLKPGESSLVFNRFWRADPSRARTLGGTGLGLSIALEDAHLHGGWLQAWGEPGGGSQFRLTLPRHVGAELVRSPIPLEPDDSRANRGLEPSGSPYRRGPRPAPEPQKSAPAAAEAGRGPADLPRTAAVPPAGRKDGGA